MSDNTEERLNFDDWSNAPDKFALRVQGDAMIGDHIADGDFVVIHRESNPANGKIVALRDHEGEPTLRHFHRMKNGQIRLETSDGRARSIVNGDSVAILGVLVGVVRKF